MKSLGNGFKVLIIVLVLVILFGGITISKYNKIVEKEELVNKGFSNIDSMLQRRFDLIPNLVNTVKGYAAHEKDVIDEVTSARKSYLNSETVEDKASANEKLSNALNNLLVVVENYPDLKASEEFTRLQDELSGTENRIAVARKDYNDNVSDYNSFIKKFPNKIIAGIFNFGTKEYFKAEKSASETPKVEF